MTFFIRKFCPIIFAFLLLSAIPIRSNADSVNANASILMASPKSFFLKLTDALRKIYPDPKFEMQMSLYLIPTGFPSFNGVSQSRAAALCFFDNPQNPDSPDCVAVMEADDTSRMAKLLLGANKKFKKSDGILATFLNGPINDSDAKLETSIKLVKNKNCDFAKIFADALTVARIAKYFGLEDFAKTAERELKNIAVDLKPRDNNVNLDCALTFKSEGKVSKAISLLDAAESKSGILKYLPDGAALLAYSRLKNSDTQKFIDYLPLGDFANTAMLSESMKLAKKCDGTYASASMIKGGKVFNISLMPTSADFSELIEFAQKNPVTKSGLNGIKIEIFNRIVTDGTVKYLETKLVQADKKDKPTIAYCTIINKVMLNSDSLELFLSTIKNIECEKSDMVDIAKHIADVNADAAIIIDNNELINSLFESKGVGLSEKIPETLLSADVNGTRVDLKITMPFKALRAYLELVQMSAFKKQK